MGEAKYIYFTCLKYYIVFERKRSNMGEKKVLRSVQVFGRKKTSTAVAHCKSGKGLIKVNGRPLHLVEPRTLRQKLEEPVLLLGKRPVLGCRHSRARQRRRSHRSSLRHSTGHFQVFGGLLSKVRGRGFQERDQRYFDRIRSLSARCRSKKERAQEVRRSRSQSQIPKVLPLNLGDLKSTVKPGTQDLLAVIYDVDRNIVASYPVPDRWKIVLLVSFRFVSGHHLLLAMETLKGDRGVRIR